MTPSRVTAVPGSQGPKNSGSVIVAVQVPTQASARETTSDDEQDVEWEHGDPSTLGLEIEFRLWTPLITNPAGGVTASKDTLRCSVTLSVGCVGGGGLGC